MTTYLRQFNRAALKAARQAVETAYEKAKTATSRADPMSSEHDLAATRLEDLTNALHGLDVPVNGEELVMKIACEGWEKRARDLDLPKKGVKREADREAYMQGVIAALVAAGLMTMERANQIGFLTAIGRLGEYMAGKVEA